MALSPHTLRRRVSAAATVLTLSVALPLAVGATPAYAQGNLNISKTHTGDFARGGQGTYLITVSNTDETEAIGPTVMTDALPQGLTVATFNADGDFGSCAVDATLTVVTCNTDLPPDSLYTVTIVVDVAEDAPCAVTNTATVVEQAGGGLSARASDPTPITGGDCGGGGTGNGSVLPIDLNLSRILPTYNNSTNNTFHSRGTTNTTTQDSHQNP
ncbi:hypothetical protein [Streptomyces sp. YKOK-I1]